MCTNFNCKKARFSNQQISHPYGNKIDIFTTTTFQDLLKPIFRGLLILLLATACGGEKPSEVEAEVVPDIEETWIINRSSGDTIKSGVPTFFDQKNPTRIQKGDNAIKEKGGKVASVEYPLKLNIGLVNLKATHLFVKDSSLNMSPSVCDSLPPKEIIVEPIITLVREPELRQVLPSVYKDNAQFDIRSLTIDQGLPTNNVWNIIQDKEGFIWLATDKGLIKYDGLSIKVYDEKSGLPERYITCLAIDQEENLWLGTRSSGYVKYDGNKFTNYPIDSIALDKQVSKITFDQNNILWSAVQFGGVVKFDYHKFYAYQQDQGIDTRRPTTGISVDADNTKWITGFGVGLYSIEDNGDVRRYNEKGASPLSGYINDVLIDNDGNKLFSHWNSNFSMVRGDSVYRYQIDSLPMSDLITEIIQDQKGNYWMSGYGAGLYYWDVATNEATFYGVEMGLNSLYVNDICLDKNGGLWVTTDGGGLCHLQTNSFKNINKYSGLENDFVYEVFEHNSKHYLSTNKGLVVYADSKIKHYVSSDENKNKILHQAPDVLVDSKNNIWLTSMNAGLVRINEEGGLIRMGTSHGIPHNPSSLDTTSDGTVWVAGWNSYLVKLTDTALYNYSYKQGLALDNISDLLITDEDVFWVGSNAIGLAKIIDDSITYYTTKEGLYSNVINHIAEDNSGRIWVCTEEGLSYYENEELNQVANENFKCNIKGLIQDEQNRYWITTENGLFVLEPIKESQKNWQIDDYIIRKFDKGNGLNNASFLENSVFINSKNELMMGSQGGLVVRNLNDLEFDNQPPKCYLLSLRINGKQIDYRALQNKRKDDQLENSDDIIFDGVQVFNNLPTNLSLPSDLNHLTFEYTGLNWSDAHHLDFFYYLEGVEENWNVGHSNNIAEYRNLPFGDFVFHLKCVSRSGLESEEIAYPFTIQRPWYHTWLARIIFVLIFGLIIFGIVKWRTFGLRKRQKLLEAEVEQATADIRSQKELVEKEKEKVEEAHDQLNVKNQEILDSINYAKRIQNAILPSNELLTTHLGDSFVYYQPKDIVAGDFYWLETIVDGSDSKGVPIEKGVLFAAADCTGHGVPGAMVSVICSNGLNRAVKEFSLSNPGAILDKTRELVIAEFKKSNEDVKDGMDIAICRMEKTAKGKTLISYAGAHNPLWIIRKDSEVLEEIKADKQPIGVFDHAKPFTTHQIELLPGDTFYIFSDGFADQFGGDKGKKMKTSNFKELLLSIRDQNMKDQGAILETEFKNWKGEFEQLDDVCVIGVRV